MPVAVHRMRGQVKAEGILFLRHSLRQRPGADRRQPYRRKPRPAVSEQGVLPALALIGGGGSMAPDGSAEAWTLALSGVRQSNAHAPARISRFPLLICPG